MQITITDEPARIALESALWQVFYDKLDHYSSTPLSSDIYKHAGDLALARATRNQDAAVDAMLADFSAVHASINEARRVELGVTLDLPVEAAQLRSGFESCVYSVESSNDGREFWDLSPEQRRVASDVRDSAVRLRDALSPTEALA